MLIYIFQLRHIKYNFTLGYDLPLADVINNNIWIKVSENSQNFVLDKLFNFVSSKILLEISVTY